MKKYIVLILAIISMIYVFTSVKAEDTIIPDEAIRFRVIANSNTIYDQNIKVQLKNVVQNKIFELTKGTETIEETRKILKDNIDLLKNYFDILNEREKEVIIKRYGLFDTDELTKETLKNLGYDKDYKINYGYNYFPKKKYKSVTYKEGMYESLVITLGTGEGDNWWCVLFPPLCLVEADESTTSDAEYTFFIKEIIDKYTK